MQLSNRKNKGPSVELQMTSMIDVTFLLLIFFMITASFTKTERELDPQMKVNKQAPTSKQSQVEPAIIDLLKTEAGFIMRLGGREFTTAAELIPILRQMENKGDGAFVRVPPDVPFDLPATAIQACKSAGFPFVSYVPKE
jgi:biopolymer transport protein ExbD